MKPRGFRRKEWGLKNVRKTELTRHTSMSDFELIPRDEGKDHSCCNSKIAKLENEITELRKEMNKNRKADEKCRQYLISVLKSPFRLIKYLKKYLGMESSSNTLKPHFD
jgi:ribosomal protein S15P/S13E